jgi:hypothetical protein
MSVYFLDLENCLLHPETLSDPEDCPPQLSEKSHIPYCQAVMAESQRLGNISPMSLPHTASDDVQVGGCKLQKGCTRLIGASDNVYQLLTHGHCFSPGTPAFSTTKSGRHDITEILLKVALNT